jgi:hypothetical protein
MSHVLTFLFALKESTLTPAAAFSYIRRMKKSIRTLVVTFLMFIGATAFADSVNGHIKFQIRAASKTDGTGSNGI